MSLGVNYVSEDAHAVFSIRIGDRDHTVRSRPIDPRLREGAHPSPVLQVLHASIVRLEGGVLESKKEHKRVTAALGKQQATQSTITPETLSLKPGFGEIRFITTPAPEYRATTSLGWVRYLMSRKLFENAFEPTINDLLADRAEWHQQYPTRAKLELTRINLWHIALMVLAHSLQEAAGQMLRDVRARLSW